ncbi:hypothetical protein [Agromyces sp. M3QZ16-3]|uniref:hypothetical protein n=1 Tax=Agromyces sp. M3QZ16-3 TaxID=3447585 RepID=UPI003F690649
MRPNAAVGAATATLLVLALSGCTFAAADPAPSPTAPPTAPAAEPTTADALDCDGIVPTSLVADALQGAAAEPVPPVRATHWDHDAFEAILVEGLGGLDCSWRVGSGMPVYNDPSDWAYLRVAVLPDAADEWVPLATYENSPSTMTRRIGGLDASFEGGDLGWTYSAPVGDDWVLVTVRAAGLTAWGGRFRGMDIGIELDRIDEVAAAAFASVAAALPGELGTPLVEVGDRRAECRGGLDPKGLAMATGASVEDVTVSEPSAPARSFEEAVALRAGLFTCTVDGGEWANRITTVRGFDALIDRFTEPDTDVAFSPMQLDAVPEGHEVTAYVANDAEDPARYAVLAIPGSLYWIDGEDPGAIARAIVAQTY